MLPPEAKTESSADLETETESPVPDEKVEDEKPAPDTVEPVVQDEPDIVPDEVVEEKTSMEEGYTELSDTYAGVVAEGAVIAAVVAGDDEPEAETES